MKKLILALLLLPVAAMAQTPMTPLRLAVIHVDTVASVPVSCASGASPDIVTDDTGVAYTCTGAVYVVIPGSMSGTGTTDYVARWITAATLGVGALADNGQQVSVIGAPLGVPYRLAVGYDSSHYLKISTDSGNRTTLEAIGATPKIDLATGEVRIINDATEKLQLRRAAASTQGVGVGVASTGTTWTVTTSAGASNGFDIVPSASWSSGTVFRALDYLGASIFAVNVNGTVTTNPINTPLTEQYDANNKVSIATSSVGDTTITPTVQTPSSTTKLLLIQPASGTGLLTNGASSFQVNDLAARQRFWIGRYASNAAATATRMGFDTSNYMQFTGGTAAGSEGTFSVVGLTGLTFSPNVTHSASTFLTTVGPTIGAGSDADLTLETNNQGATDPTVTYATAATTYLPARLRGFHNQQFSMDEPAAGASRGWWVPLTAPVNSSTFLGASHATFNGYIDAGTCMGYNTDCQTGRFNTSEHSMAANWEWTYDSSGTAGRQTWVEHNWNFVSSAGVGWRPFYFHLDTAANSGDGQANWDFITDNLEGQSSRSGGSPYSIGLKVAYPWVATNMIEGTDTNYQNAAFSNYLRVNRFDTGGSQFGTMTTMIFDQNTAGGPAADMSGREGAAYVAHFDFSPASSLSGYISGYLVNTPDAPGASATVAGTYAFRTYDLRLDRTGMTSGQAMRIDEQTVTDATEGNVHFVGTGYNHGHLQFNTTHLWESSGVLRVKPTAPTSNGDGDALVTGTSSSLHGVVLWGVTTATSASFDTGTEVCAGSSLTCVTTFDVWGTPIACGTAHTLYDGWPAECK